MGVVRRNPLPTQTEVQLLEMPECKRGRFVKQPAEEGAKAATLYEEENDTVLLDNGSTPSAAPSGLSALVNGQPSSPGPSRVLLDVDVPGMQEVSRDVRALICDGFTCLPLHRTMTCLTAPWFNAHLLSLLRRPE